MIKIDIMQPITSTNLPPHDQFAYEVKYDGFRTLLRWEKESIRLISRNNKDFTDQFPEVVHFCKSIQPEINSLLPIQMDGELVVLNNKYQGNFPLIQQRGRLKNKDRIQKVAGSRPATFIAFDLLKLDGMSYQRKKYQDRRLNLQLLFRKLNIMGLDLDRIRLIHSYEDAKDLSEIIFSYKGEGIIAKRKESFYQPEKNHNDWFKIKNWRTIHCFLTHLDIHNDYFSVGVYHNDEVIEIGKCKHGLDPATFSTLKKLFIKNGKSQKSTYQLPPSICAAIHTLDMNKGVLRDPGFSTLLPEYPPDHCSLQALKMDLAMLPSSVELTNMNKVLWPDKELTKGDMLVYLREISPYMLPHLKDRAVTLIRCPDGVAEKSFFQKSLPSYAPSFLKTIHVDDKDLIVCDQLESLIWLGNHGAIEYHIPFQTVYNRVTPREIAFDLDPPNQNRFDLAIQAARLIKCLTDDLNLASFIKTSGKTGLQIHIPIPEGSMTYEQTALFTKAIATTIANEYPDLFTVERFKKNRKGRLYIDYVQYGKDKTLIAPYSPRKTDHATVATPLFWEEINEQLTPDQFTIMNVVKRVQTLGCPFVNYFDAGDHQKLDLILQLINNE